jgi:DNA-binding HxlR family transcriptional regulator
MSRRPTLTKYVMTEAGEALFPALSALRDWGQRYVTAPRRDEAPTHHVPPQ